MKGETSTMRKFFFTKSSLAVLCIFMLIIVSIILVRCSTSKTEINTKRNRFLLLDNRIIDLAENAKLAPGTVKKHEANPLFIEDKPWEKRFDNLYGNVMYDTEDRLYKCWYCPFIVDYSAKGMTLEERKKEYDPPEDREMAICYATSKDGIHWEKPNLGLVEYNGSKENNIIWRGPHGAGVFKDAQETNPARRYKVIFQGLNVSFSSDGIHWAPAQKLEGLRVAGDTHNNAFWAPTRGKYVGITRTWREVSGRSVRQVGWMESDDFLHWTPVEVVMEGTTNKLQTYAMPVFYYGGVYLGLVAIHSQPPIDRVWTELTWSPDAKEWHRIAEGEPLIPCSEKALDYDYGCVYACATPVFLEDEIRLYYGGSDWMHFGWRSGCLALATLRPDGFAGYEQKEMEKPAKITTTAIPYKDQNVRLTADVYQGGSIKVSIVDNNGENIATAKPISETVTDELLKWNKPVKMDEIRFKFDFINAKLYSFSFDD